MYLNDTVKRMMEEDGYCSDVTSPGEYVLLYFDSNANVICGTCATKQPKEISNVVTYNEGSHVDCGDCKRTLRAYGKDEETYCNSKDYWCYGNKNMILYVISGVKAQKYASAHRLIHNFGMTQEEAHNYLEKLGHR